MKLLLISLAVFSICLPAYSAGDEATVSELRAEIAQLKTDLAKAQEQSVTYFSASVALRSKFESAVERIHEANGVASQWRAQAMNFQRELVYTKAIAQNRSSVDMDALNASTIVPRFHTSNILREPNVVTPRDGVAPTYIAMR